MAIRRRSARLKGRGKLTAKATKIRITGRVLSNAAELSGSVTATGIAPVVEGSPSQGWKQIEPQFWYDGDEPPTEAAARICGAVQLAGRAEVRQAWAQPGLLQDGL
jgi:hypothetical protein